MMISLEKLNHFELNEHKVKTSKFLRCGDNSA